MPPRHSAPATVVELHPEHLLDKLGAGQLSASERKQLRSHAAACEVCRFELLLREDLAIESLKHGRAHSSGLLESRADG